MENILLEKSNAPKKLITRAAWVVMFIFFINYAAMTFFWYSTIWWFDMPMHFLGGFWLGLMALWAYLLVRRKQPVLQWNSVFWTVFILTLCVGVAWELFEVGIDRFITLVSHNSLDTVSDIFFDLAGAFTAFFYAMRKRYISFY